MCVPLCDVLSPILAPKPMSQSPSMVQPDGDVEMLSRLYAGDVAALDGLYVMHSGYVMAIALRISRTREEAEEVVQEVFWQLWKGNARYDSRRGKLTTWLFTIARSRALDRLRRRREVSNRDPLELLGDVASSDNPLVDTFVRERRSRVLAALATLPEEQRESIELAFYRGLTHSEIAARTQEPLGTVKSRIKRGLARLRDALAGEEVTE